MFTRTTPELFSNLLLAAWPLIRQPFVILLDQLPVRRRNLVVTGRPDVFLRHQQLQRAAELQFDRLERIDNLLGEPVNLLWISTEVSIARHILRSAKNIIQLSAQRAVRSQ